MDNILTQRKKDRIFTLIVTKLNLVINMHTKHNPNYIKLGLKEILTFVASQSSKFSPEHQPDHY